MNAGFLIKVLNDPDDLISEYADKGSHKQEILSGDAVFREQNSNFAPCLGSKSARTIILQLKFIC
ncbi:hypothetical protein [Arachidicoccus terrestris]|uniref:hypothetical protein n=1 Tax=Arachidicoccus terrestris TaxID=2875539 RepID=UPI001CC7C1AB|nr:hypothetical protein [Arachidicoccus terrestris]UAY57075.1 hypothetical protein K9M52_08830 [Arachidicoccus terrestris]